MFPEPDDCPTFLFKGAANRCVALAVATELRQPVATVTAGVSTVLRTAMPKAPVHENGEPNAAEDEVGVTADGVPAAPPGDPTGAEDRRQL